MMKMWSAHHQVFSSRGRGSVHPRTARSTTRGGHTAQRVVVRVGVVEQGQTESYYSPEHGEQKSHGDDSVEAQPWGAAGVGGLAMCHNVPHGRHNSRAAAFYAAPACGSMSRCTVLAGRGR